MAAIKDKQSGGYDCKFFITPPGALLCQICQLVARDPQLSVCCGNNFCKTCLDTRDDEEGCPSCIDSDCFFTTFPNKLSDREIKKLLIWCTKNEKGCVWRSELVNLEEHLNVCEFEDVECLQKCGLMIERVKMDDHLSNECPCRKVECEYCHVTGEYHMIVGQHREQCPKVPVSCPNECGLDCIGKDELQSHLRKCPQQKVHCKYHNIGCEARILNGSQDEHDDACMKEHFHLMRNELAQTKEELQDLKLRVGDKEYYKTWEAKQPYKNQVDKASQVVIKKENVQPDKNRVDEGSQVVIKKEHVEYKKEAVGVQENHMDGQALSEVDVVTSELRRTQTEFVQWKKQSDFLMRQILGTMEWRTQLDLLSTVTENPDVDAVAPVIIKVTEVQIKKEFKMVYKSPAFFTSPNGHKVCLCILPGGTGNEVTSFSVHIMNLSAKDTELSGTFTVSLLNQLEDIEHCRTKLKYESNRKSQSSVDGRVSLSDYNNIHVMHIVLLL